MNPSRGRGTQNWMTVDLRERAVEIFHFAEVINEWPLNRRITETRVRIWSFLFAYFMYQRPIIYRFYIHLQLLVNKLYFSFVFVLHSVIFEKIFNLHDSSNSRILKKVTKYISWIAKSFDSENLHSRFQASIFRLFVLIKRLSVFDI